jgi:phage-related holin
MKSTLFSFIQYFCVGIVAFFAPILYAFILIIILVFVDTITGIMKAGRKDINSISSKKAFALIPKITFYCLLSIVAHATQLYVIPEVPFVKISLIGISFIEIKSIDENFRALFGFSFIDKTIKAIRDINQIKRHKE